METYLKGITSILNRTKILNSTPFTQKMYKESMEGRGEEEEIVVH